MEDLERKERLAEFFRGNPAIWKDIEAEIELSQETAVIKSMAVSCSNREFYAGFYQALGYMLVMKDYFKAWKNPSNDTSKE